MDGNSTTTKTIKSFWNIDEVNFISSNDGGGDGGGGGGNNNLLILSLVIQNKSTNILLIGLGLTK